MSYFQEIKPSIIFSVPTLLNKQLHFFFIYFYFIFNLFLFIFIIFLLFIFIYFYLFLLFFFIYFYLFLFLFKKRFYAGLFAKVNAGPSVIRFLFNVALNLASKRAEKRDNILEKIVYPYFNMTILSKIRNTFGGNLRMIIVGGAGFIFYFLFY